MVYEALGHEPSEAALGLRRRLAPLIGIKGPFGRIAGKEGKTATVSSESEPCSPDDSTPPPDRSATCPRNGRALRSRGQWRASGIFTRAPNFTSNTIISALASVRYGSALDGPASWVQSVSSLLSTGGGTFDRNDLASLISRCQRLSNRGVAGSFLQMLSAIQLTFKCQE